ncbi:MAG: TetR/AcrR family transcriptional regulator [Actinomycetota bacterium]
MGKSRTYVKVARAEAEQRTRAALLDSAEQAFFAGAWQATTLEAIAAGAGVTKQTLLRHFGTKDGLLEQTFQRAFERVQEQRMRVPGNDIEAAIENLLQHYDSVGDASLKIAAMRGGGLIAEIGRRARQLHYDWIDHAFGARLGFMPQRERAHVRAVLITICDVRAWDILVNELGLNRGETKTALILSIRRLLTDTTDDREPVVPT